MGNTRVIFLKCFGTICPTIIHIEAFDDAKEAEAKAAAEEAANAISTDERIAAALEAQVLMSMPDGEI